MSSMILEPFKLLVLACLLDVVSSHAALVGSVGYTNDFSSQPATADWATVGVTGTTADVTTAAALDANVQALTATGVGGQIVSSTGNPPGVNAAATCSSIGYYLQTRPTQNKFTVLMAKLINNTGTNATTLHVRYDYTTNRASSVAEEVRGQRVFWSLTGASNSWTFIPALSQTEQGRLNADVPLTSPWNNGNTLFLLWADDNGSGSPDDANNIDNFFATASRMVVPVTIYSQPAGTIALTNTPVTFCVVASGSSLTYQWYCNNQPIPGANGPSYVIPSLQLTNAGTYWVVVSNSVNTVISSNASLLVFIEPNSTARLRMERAGNGRQVIRWRGRGVLEAANDMTGPWTAVPNGFNPYTNSSLPSPRFFRLNQVVDATTMRKKVLCGYQGWFRCPGDGGSQWIHWSRSSSTIASNTLTFEMWPEMSEYTNQYPAPGFTYPDGTQAKLFSSQDQQTVDRHFDWMLEHGIDGVFASRFVVSVANHPTNVLEQIRAASNRKGRTFALMYDMSGQNTNTLFTQLTNDWCWLVDNTRIVQDPRYLRHNGKPVLMVWGFFADRFSTNVAHQIIDFFKTNSTYGVTLVGGGEWWWRTESTPGWADVFRRFDVYSPWNVGNVSVSGTNKYASTGYWAQDIAATRSAGMLYLPVIYPGFSWDNLQQQAPGTSKIPRLGGEFFWKQFYTAGNLGLDMAFVAMFDEVDEGTAIFKVANTPPAPGYFVTYEGLPSDWYLRLAAEGSKVLSGERPNSATIPIAP